MVSLFRFGHGGGYIMVPVMVFNFILLMTDGVEHFFICFLTIHVSPSLKCLRRSLAHFSMESFVLLVASKDLFLIFWIHAFCQINDLWIFSPR